MSGSAVGGRSSDLSGTLVAFVTHAKHYSHMKIDANYSAVIKHLDILMAISESEDKIDVFDPSQPEVVDVFTFFISFLLDENSPTDVILRVVAIMKNLADQPRILKKLASFHMYSSMACFLSAHGLSANDPLVIECLQLLELMSDGARNVTYIESHLSSLIIFLLSEINNPNEELSNTVLCILSDLCRSSPAVKHFILSQPDIKGINRRLIGKLCSHVYTTVIYAVSILAHLTIQHPKYEQVFTRKHCFDAFELIVHLLVTNEASSKAALELFFDFVRMPNIFKLFVKYEKLEKSLLKVLRSCFPDSPIYQIENCLKFIWPFANSPESLNIITRLMCVKEDSGKHQGDIIILKVVHPILMRFSYGVHYAMGEASLYAFKIVKSVVTALGEEEGKYVEASLENMVKNLVKGFEECVEFDSVCQSTQLETYIAYFDLLFVLMQKGIAKKLIVSSLGDENMLKLASLMLNKYPIDMDSVTYNETAVDLVLSMLMVSAASQGIDLPFATSMIRQLKDSAVLIYLAYALTSSNSERVYRGLYVLTQYRSYVHLPILGHYISKASSNLRLSARDEFAVFPKHKVPAVVASAETDLTSSATAGHSRTESDERNVEDLIQQFKSGLDVKDMKLTEMLEIYEEKINMMIKKENELHGLISAKSVALAESDRLLGQYHCHQSQADAEAAKLSKLLKDAEKRYETMKDLKNSVQVQLEETRMQFKELNEEFTLVKNAAAKCGDNLLQTQEKLMEADKQIKVMEGQAVELELKINDLSIKLEHTGYSLSKKVDECLELEASKKSLESAYELKKTELTNMEQQMKLLEVAGRRRDAALAEKDAKIKALSDELQQTKYITDMIHKMSGGKGVDPSLPDK